MVLVVLAVVGEVGVDEEVVFPGILIMVADVRTSSGLDTFLL